LAERERKQQQQSSSRAAAAAPTKYKSIDLTYPLLMVVGDTNTTTRATATTTTRETKSQNFSALSSAFAQTEAVNSPRRGVVDAAQLQLGRRCLETPCSNILLALQRSP